MIIQDLDKILLISIFFAFCKNTSLEYKIGNESLAVKNVDNVSKLKLFATDTIQYYNIEIFNNNSFPIEIFIVDKDSSINFIDNYLFYSKIPSPNNQYSHLTETGAIRNDIFSIITIDSFSSYSSKVSLFYPKVLFEEDKFLYSATIQYQKKCAANSYKSLINNFIARDSLDCDHFYHKELFFFLKKSGNNYNIKYIDVPNDSIFREKRNIYLK